MKTCNNKSCKNIVSEEKYKWCESCRDKERNKKKRRREYKKQNNICLQCSSPAVEGKAFCERCAVGRKEYYAINKSLLDQEELAAWQENRHTYYLKSRNKKLWEKAGEIKLSAQRRAEEHNARCEITAWEIRDILDKGVCQLTDIPFQCDFYAPAALRKPRGPWSPSLDRWDSGDPNYLKGNVYLICWAFNSFKHRWKTEDWIRLLRYCLFSFKLTDQLPVPHEIERNSESPSIPTKDFQIDSTKFVNWIDQARFRAKNEGATFDLTKSEVEEMVRVGACQVTGIPFDLRNILQPDLSLTTNPRASALSAALFSPRTAVAPPTPTELANVTPLTPSRIKDERGRHYNPWVPSLHRKDPKIRSYSKENTQCVVWAYNVACVDFEPDDFLKLLKTLGRKCGFLPREPDDTNTLLMDLLTKQDLPSAKVELSEQALTVSAPPETKPEVKVMPKRDVMPTINLASNPVNPAELSDQELISKYKRLYPHLSDAEVVLEGKKIERIKKSLLGQK